MKRMAPLECEHGRMIDWGDFGDIPEECEECGITWSLGVRILVWIFLLIKLLVYIASNIPVLGKYIEPRLSNKAYDLERWLWLKCIDEEMIV